MRWRGHFEGDAMLYRAATEVTELRANKDPLKRFLERVEGVLPQEDIDAIDREVLDAVDEAVARARAAQVPSPEQVFTDVYVSY
ncbi:Acetoin:2,6-dichlorophenolindophenol oxidoreductase subunit alpha [compost metagenome]